MELPLELDNEEVFYFPKARHYVLVVFLFWFYYGLIPARLHIIKPDEWEVIQEE